MKLSRYFQPPQSSFQRLVGIVFLALAVVFTLIAVGVLDLGAPVLLGIAVMDALILPFIFWCFWTWASNRWAVEDKGNWRRNATKAKVVFVGLVMLITIYVKLGLLLNIPFAGADHENFAVRECIRILVGSDSPYTQYLQ